MRYLMFVCPVIALHICYSQNLNSFGSIDLDDRISTIDFVEILNDNKAEAIYYYENNWKVLRIQAIKNDNILSYQLLETPSATDSPFHLILMTTYANKEQYDKREENFSKLIKERGELKLLNTKKPPEFRKVIFGKEPVKHLN